MSDPSEGNADDAPATLSTPIPAAPLGERFRALSAEGVSKCNVIGQVRPCDVRDVAVISRTVGGEPQPGIDLICEAVTP